MTRPGAGFLQNHSAGESMPRGGSHRNGIVRDPMLPLAATMEARNISPVGGNRTIPLAWETSALAPLARCHASTPLNRFPD